MCYTYNNLNRVVTRTIKNLSDDSVVLTEMFVYDSAGNITFSLGNSFVYDTNNRLTEFNGNSIMYDPDGNMLSDGLEDFTYDSSNRLIVAKGHSYTYNAENVRIRNLCEEEDTIYTYDTNCKLSKLLCKTTNGVTTKYVYGRGLIGEETNNVFKTYHFDNRGSTVAITNFDGGITDTFTYDTYGKCINRTGTSSVIFGYNGRDGVVTDSNGLIYMRARYYAPYMKRFVNADIIAGDISNAVTLNRFAYANGNPVSFIDPFGLSAKSMYSESGMLYRNFATISCPPPTKGHIMLGPLSNQANNELIKSSYEEYSTIVAGDSKPNSNKNPNTSDDSNKQETNKQETNKHCNTCHTSKNFHSVSIVYVEGNLKSNNNVLSVYGNASVMGAYAGLIDDGWGAKIGVSAATAQGNVSVGNLALSGDAKAAYAEANASFVYQDGLQIGAEAKAAVATAGTSFAIDLWFMKIEIGADMDLLSVGAEASVTASRNDQGQFEIGAEAGIGALLFGLGLDISFIFG